MLDFGNRESIKKFIKETKTDVYLCNNVDGEIVTVTVQQGESMLVKTLQSNDWYRIHEYDKEGYCISEIYEK